MPKYLIERNVPGAGRMSQVELQAISQRSCSVLSELGTEIQWLESFVTDDRIFCVYLASNPELIRKHGAEGGFPVDRITEVREVISPMTAEQGAAT